MIDQFGTGRSSASTIASYQYQPVAGYTLKLLDSIKYRFHKIQFHKTQAISVSLKCLYLVGVVCTFNCEVQSTDLGAQHRTLKEWRLPGMGCFIKVRVNITLSLSFYCHQGLSRVLIPNPCQFFSKLKTIQDKQKKVGLTFFGGQPSVTFFVVARKLSKVLV